MIRGVLRLVILSFFPLWANAYSHKNALFARHLSVAERKHNMPKGLLSAISKVESGRYHERHKKVISWPWVIHAEGEGQFFRTKQEAISAVRTLRARGIKNIDVGLMQVNLLHHPEAFSSLEQAFDPKRNIEYAAKFLAGLKKEHASWSKAVAHYHSALPAHHIPYRHKVYKMWREEGKGSSNGWLERDYFRTEATEENPRFRPPQFRIIRVRAPDKASSHMISRPKKLQKAPLKTKEKQRSQTLRFSKTSDHLQNHFRFIKPKKKGSFQLAQKQLKIKKIVRCLG